MFGNLFKKKPEKAEKSRNVLVAQLNARIQPMHRGEFFEDPLDERLKNEELGQVSGGGTLLAKDGEIGYCDIEIELDTDNPSASVRVVEILEGLGAPKGSKLHVERNRTEILFGRSEGLAIYLNGTDLPDDVYSSCDSNFVQSELERLVAPQGRVLSHWQGPTETAFYLYGESFGDMQNAIEEFIATYPLCKKSRIEQIA